MERTERIGNVIEQISRVVVALSEELKKNPQSEEVLKSLEGASQSLCELIGVKRTDKPQASAFDKEAIPSAPRRPQAPEIVRSAEGIHGAIRYFREYEAHYVYVNRCWRKCSDDLLKNQDPKNLGKSIPDETILQDGIYITDINPGNVTMVVNFGKWYPDFEKSSGKGRIDYAKFPHQFYDDRGQAFIQIGSRVFNFSGSDEERLDCVKAVADAKNQVGEKEWSREMNRRNDDPAPNRRNDDSVSFESLGSYLCKYGWDDYF